MQTTTVKCDICEEECTGDQVVISVHPTSWNNPDFMFGSGDTLKKFDVCGKCLKKLGGEKIVERRKEVKLEDVLRELIREEIESGQ